MNDLANLMLFLAGSGVQFDMFTDPDCIDEDSVAAGAMLAISIRGAAHMNFDTNGNLVGSSTDCAKSHRRKE
jgi:hypothetical protein